MRAVAAVLLVLVGALLAYGASDLPGRGRVDAPVHTQVAEQYLARAEHDTHTPNVVTAILADYRGFDTFGETTVVFVAGIATALILSQRVRAGE
ncbi:MAG TPA: hydrogen gas-evolving membrane-bound hydrogenase subunit E [Bacillota bacterium]